MSSSLGPALPGTLVRRLSQTDLAGRLGSALPFITVDSEGYPHPMLVSYVEVRAYDTRTLGLVIGGRSGSARNLRDRGTGTLVIVEPDVTVYVKTRAVDGPLGVPGGEVFGLGYFLLEVTDVIEDAPGEHEGAPRITGGLGYTPPPSLEEPYVRATLAALASPRARA